MSECKSYADMCKNISVEESINNIETNTIRNYKNWKKNTIDNNVKYIKDMLELLNTTKTNKKIIKIISDTVKEQFDDVAYHHNFFNTRSNIPRINENHKCKICNDFAILGITNIYESEDYKEELYLCALHCLTINYSSITKFIKPIGPHTIKTILEHCRTVKQKYDTSHFDANKPVLGTVFTRNKSSNAEQQKYQPCNKLGISCMNINNTSANKKLINYKDRTKSKSPVNDEEWPKLSNADTSSIASSSSKIDKKPIQNIDTAIINSPDNIRAHNAPTSPSLIEFTTPKAKAMLNSPPPMPRYKRDNSPLCSNTSQINDNEQEQYSTGITQQMKRQIARNDEYYAADQFARHNYYEHNQLLPSSHNISRYWNPPEDYMNWQYHQQHYNSPQYMNMMHPPMHQPMRPPMHPHIPSRPHPFNDRYSYYYTPQYR